jgi:hypothetical protein
MNIKKLFLLATGILLFVSINTNNAFAFSEKTPTAIALKASPTPPPDKGLGPVDYHPPLKVKRKDITNVVSNLKSLADYMRCCRPAVLTNRTIPRSEEEELNSDYTFIITSVDCQDDFSELNFTEIPFAQKETLHIGSSPSDAKELKAYVWKSCPVSRENEEEGYYHFNASYVPILISCKKEDISNVEMPYMTLAYLGSEIRRGELEIEITPEATMKTIEEQIEKGLAKYETLVTWYLDKVSDIFPLTSKRKIVYFYIPR